MSQHFLPLGVVLLLFVGCQSAENARISPPPLPTTIPSDSDLVERFENHREMLQTLVRMITDDDLGLVDAQGHLMPEARRLSDERQTNYRSMLSGASFLYMTRYVDVATHSDVVMFYAASRDVGLETWSKGLMYSGSLPGPLVLSLDDDLALERSPGRKYRRVAPAWYIFYHHDDLSVVI